MSLYAYIPAFFSFHSCCTFTLTSESSKQQTTDSSDAEYEKRHRKYETFEKRQRLREKEKLKHEQYKLKERIEQLRAIDGAAFLSLPQSSFPPTPGRYNDDVEDDESIVSLPGAHVNGAAAHNEGERRRREMLDVALNLEERYRTLLPPERKGLEREKKSGGQSSISASVEPEFETNRREPRRKNNDGESDIDPEDYAVEPTKKEVEKIKLRIKLLPRSATALQHPSSSPKSAWPTRMRKDSLPPPMTKSPLTRRSKMQTSSPLAPMSSLLPRLDYNQRPSMAYSPAHPAQSPSTAPSLIQDSTPAPVTPVASPEVMSMSAPGVTEMSDDSYIPQAGEQHFYTNDSISQGRLRKRMRGMDSESRRTGVNESDVHDQLYDASGSIPASPHQSTSRSSQPAASKAHVSYAGAAGKAERTTSLLMISALRNSSAPKARKTQRHLTAFGTKVPPEVDEFRDFEIPRWVHQSWNDDEDDAEVDAPPSVDEYSNNVLRTSPVDRRGVSVGSPYAMVESQARGSEAMTAVHEFVEDVP